MCWVSVEKLGSWMIGCPLDHWVSSGYFLFGFGRTAGEGCWRTVVLVGSFEAVERGGSAGGRVVGSGREDFIAALIYHKLILVNNLLNNKSLHKLYHNHN